MENGKKILITFILVLCINFNINLFSNSSIVVFNRNLYKNLLELKKFNSNKFYSKNMKNKIKVIIFFNPLKIFHKRLIIYSQILYNRFKDKNICFIAITSQIYDLYKKSKLNKFLKYPVLIDENKKIHKIFSVEDCCGGIFIFNKKGVMEFNSTPLIDIESLRQLIEQELFGKIKYTFNSIKRQKVFAINKRMGSFEIENAFTKNKVSLNNFDEDNLIVTFFSSICSACKTGKRIKSLIQMRNITKAKIKKKNKFIIVFFNPYDENDLKEWETHINMPFEKYFTDNFFSESENYITNNYHKTDPFSVLLNMKRIVVFVENPGMNEKEVIKNIIKYIKE